MMVVSMGTIVLLHAGHERAGPRLRRPSIPQFDTENAAQIPTSFGGLVYMMASVTLLAVIIMIEAVPVAAELRAWQIGVGGAASGELVLAGLAVVAVCVSATIVPLRLSSKRLQRMEW